MNEELVSVIIPAYNVERFLDECICSLLCQTYANYEIIIIDDGSTDNTYDIGKRFAKKNSVVKIIHQENQGVSTARNVGMQNANGKLILFVDADDVVAPKYIESLVSCIEKADMGMVGFTLKKEQLSMKPEIIVEYESSYDVLENLLCTTKYDGYLWNKVFKRDIIDEYTLVFRKNTTVWEDLLFVLEYLKKSDQIAILDEKLYFYRCRGGSAVNTMGIDKYRSKYEVMAEIKSQGFAQTEYSKNKVSFLYFETMFSYVNQLLTQKNKRSELGDILSKVSIIELLKQKNAKLVLKFLYLKTKMNINFLGN